MEIRHLKYMLAVAEERQFHLAAKRLHIAQPALSQNIRQLEEEIGTRLFARTTRRVELTNAGKVFYQEAFHLLRALEAISRNAVRASEGISGSITIGFTETAIFGPLRGLIRKFRKRYPDVHIISKECRPGVLFELLQDGSIDAACSEEFVVNANHRSVELGKADVVLAIPRLHRLAKQTGALDLRELAGESFIFPAQDTTWSVYEKISRALANAGITPHQVYSVDNAISGIALVSTGLGVCFVPQFTKCLEEEVAFRKITPRLLLHPTLVWQKNNLSPVLANFVGLAKP